MSAQHTPERVEELLAQMRAIERYARDKEVNCGTVSELRSALSDIRMAARAAIAKTEARNA